MPIGERDDARRGWVKRVLGVDAPAASANSATAAASPRAVPILPIWRDACEDVGKQVARLQDAMRGTKRPILQRIADGGLHSVTGPLQVGLHVALVALDEANGRGRTAAVGKVRASIADFKQFLETNDVIRLLDQNPLDVPVTIRRSLGDALERIAALLPDQSGSTA